MTLLPPLKRITTLKLPKLSIFDPRNQATSAKEIVPVALNPGAILYQIGCQLRQLREEQNLSLEEMSARTQVQPRLIQAIEDGQIDILPEPVYVRGMVKRYGDSLGLDGMAISQQVPLWVTEATEFNQTTGRHVARFHLPHVKPLHVYLSYTLVIVGIGAVVSPLLNEAITPKRSLVSEVVTPKQPIIVPSILPVVVATPQATQSPPVKIGIVVTSAAWAQIGIDGTTKFTGNLKVGTKFDWVATKQVTISTNNGGGLSLSRDRQPAQPLGKLGQKQQLTIKIGK